MDKPLKVMDYYIIIVVNIIIGSTKETYRHQQYFYVISQLLSDIGIIMKTNHICANNTRREYTGNQQAKRPEV
jgi:hypothetical protein